MEPNGENGSDFKFVNQAGRPSTFSWQHYVQPAKGTPNIDITISVFNNHNSGLDNGTAPSTGLSLYHDLQNGTVETISALQDPKDIIYADSQGTYQHLPRGHNFIGYGQIAKFK